MFFVRTLSRNADKMKDGLPFFANTSRAFFPKIENLGKNAILTMRFFMKRRTLRPSPSALLNPRYDANFKALFTHNSKAGRHALKSFLEAALGAEVSNIQLMQNELPIEAEHDKQSVFDITCILNGANAVNIELQGINIDNSYDKRAEYQAAHLLNHTVKKGDDWVDMPEVFQISVLNFMYDKEVSKGVSVYTMRTKSGRTLSHRMTIIFIELPKFKSDGKGDNDVENLTAIEKWCKFLLYADDGTRQNLVRDLCKSDGGIMAASGILAKISQDDINWARQTSRELWERDQLSIKHSKERAEHELKKVKTELTESQAALTESQAALAEKDAQLLTQIRENELLRAKLAKALNTCSDDF